MSDANTKAKIISILEKRGPLVVSSIAWAAKLTSHVAEAAVTDLVVEGYLKRHEDGKRYQLTEQGRNPPPRAA